MSELVLTEEDYSTSSKNRSSEENFSSNQSTDEATTNTIQPEYLQAEPAEEIEPSNSIFTSLFDTVKPEKDHEIVTNIIDDLGLDSDNDETTQDTSSHLT